MKYIVYKTTNIVNNKIYIGVHQTENPDVFDGYLGCGLFVNNLYLIHNPKEPFHFAVKKYGVKNFKRETLKVFNNKQDALDLERWIVCESFVKSVNTYNITLGGGAPPILNKIVYQFNIKGEFVKKWFSEQEICAYYNSKVNISDIIKFKRSFAGFFWSFCDKINISDYSTEIKHGFISQYNVDGELLQIFKSSTQASIELGLKRGNICTSVFRKTPYQGFYFLKSDVDIQTVMNKNKKYIGKCNIYIYCSSGDFVKKFQTITETQKFFQQISKRDIKNAIQNKIALNGFYLSYKYCNNYFNIQHPEIKPTIKIAQYDINKNLIKIWDSVNDVKKEYPRAIKVCQGLAKSTKNYVFKYIEVKDTV